MLVHYCICTTQKEAWHMGDTSQIFAEIIQCLKQHPKCVLTLVSLQKRHKDSEMLITLPSITEPLNVDMRFKTNSACFQIPCSFWVLELYLYKLLEFNNLCVNRFMAGHKLKLTYPISQQTGIFISTVSDRKSLPFGKKKRNFSNVLFPVAYHLNNNKQ